MKKITLSVAALSLAISGFCTNPPTNQQLIKEITINVEDIIEFVKEDEYNGRMMTETLAKSYVNNLLNVLSKLEDLQTNQTDTLKQKVNYSDYINVNLVNFVDCENCDEID
tara:strand:+ start:299 stop:631 length:333 start_codon:yes stop_codon:yes gene_type:complete